MLAIRRERSPHWSRSHSGRAGYLRCVRKRVPELTKAVVYSAVASQDSARSAPWAAMDLPASRLVPGFDSGNGTRVQTARITRPNRDVLPGGPDQSDIESNSLNC